MARKAIPIDVRTIVLHESGYMCGNPVCRELITLDMHHLIQVCKKGKDRPENLLALCPNCHRRYHNNEIKEESLRAWKYILLSLNEAYSKKEIEFLLTLNKLNNVFVSDDCIFDISGLYASNYIEIKPDINTILEGQDASGRFRRSSQSGYRINLSDKGKQLINAWLSGKQIGE